MSNSIQNSFDEMYDGGHPTLKQYWKRADFSKSMAEVYEKYGPLKSVTKDWINVIVGGPVEIRAVLNSSFEKGDATETFVLIRDPDKIRLASYQIFPGTTSLRDGSP